MSAPHIDQLSYPDFVAFIGQNNTPPGGILSTKQWISMGDIRRESHLLDLACNTGFSSRHICKVVGCSGEGVDISSCAIEHARHEAAREGLLNQVRYHVGDACQLPYNDHCFTHVLGGCNFAFIADRHRALEECRRVLIANGILCVANFYYTETPPDGLLAAVHDMVGFCPDAAWTYDFWDNFFASRFHKVSEYLHDLPVLDEQTLTESIHRTIYQQSTTLGEASVVLKRQCFERLLAIRRVLNDHRRFQQYCVTAWKVT